MNATRSLPSTLSITGGLAILAATTALAADELPEMIEVTGVVRDFQERSVPDGHVDMERRPDRGFGHYTGNIETTIGPDRTPVFSGDGRKVRRQYTDSAYRPICYALYDPEQGDHAGTFRGESTGGINSAESFNQWYHDTPGVNISRPLTLVMQHQGDGRYVFDDKTDVHYKDVGFATLGGFFPIDDELFGDSAGTPHHNFHFTFELHLDFVYRSEDAQFFRFVGDDDVWVFINDELVIDLGGVHGATEQYVDLNRLGLRDGDEYKIDFFFAERHRTQSNFRVEVNFEVQTAEPPATTAAFD